MQSVRNQGDQTIYQYNALGERVRKSNNQEQTDYLYDEEGKLLGEYGKSGQAKAEYLWLGDIPVGVVKFDTTGQQATLYYVESDQLNTPRMVTTQNKKVMWQWFSEPFGSTQVVNNPAGQGPFTYNLRFPGQYYDRESGLHYNYYRDYDPATGRYIESDPIGLEAGVNTYVYVGSDPINWFDPSGLWRMEDVFPEGAPIVTIGRAFGGIAAYIHGKFSGNNRLVQEAVDGLDCNRQENVEALAIMLSMGKGNAFSKGGPPRDPKTANFLPDPSAVGAHTTLGTRLGRNGSYTQGATFDGNGKFIGRTDVTNHGRGDHASPHWHPATGANSVGPAQPLP